MSKASKNLLLVLAFIAITYAAVAIFVPSARPSLSFIDSCERTTLSINGATFRNTDELKSGLSITDQQLTDFVNSFSIYQEDGLLTACKPVGEKVSP